MTQTCLSIHDLDISYTRHGSTHQALNHVSLDLHAGEMLALVGESGSGKSTLGRAVLGILPPNASVQHGSIHIGAHNVTHLSERAWRQIRGKKVALIPQDPAHSLDRCARSVRNWRKHCAHTSRVSSSALTRGQKRSPCWTRWVSPARHNGLGSTRMSYLAVCASAYLLQPPLPSAQP
nr:ATP-binding cassette domain-containing protein [Acetobacter okinawensis]